MFLIVQSAVLSFRVLPRVILPLIGIYIASLVFWFIASILTLGYSEYISTSVTGAFVTLFGIHTALKIKGAAKPIEFSTMALYAFVFGLMIHAAKAAMTFAAYHLSLLATEKRLSHLGSWETIKNVDEAAHGAFVLHGFGLTVIFLLIFSAIIHAVFLVPMASAAQSAGRGAGSRPLLWGFGRRFIPLTVIFLLNLAPYVVFGLVSFLFFLVPAHILAFVVSIASSDPSAAALDSYDISFVLKGLAATIFTMWLHVWGWSAGALALLQLEKDPAPEPDKTGLAQRHQASDLRALRKSREQR